MLNTIILALALLFSSQSARAIEYQVNDFVTDRPMMINHFCYEAEAIYATIDASKRSFKSAVMLSFAQVMQGDCWVSVTKQIFFRLDTLVDTVQILTEDGSFLQNHLLYGYVVNTKTREKVYIFTLMNEENLLTYLNQEL